MHNTNVSISISHKVLAANWIDPSPEARIPDEFQGLFVAPEAIKSILELVELYIKTQGKDLSEGHKPRTNPPLIYLAPERGQLDQAYEFAKAVGNYLQRRLKEEGYFLPAVGKRDAHSTHPNTCKTYADTRSAQEAVKAHNQWQTIARAVDPLVATVSTGIIATWMGTSIATNSAPSMISGNTVTYHQGPSASGNGFSLIATCSAPFQQTLSGIERIGAAFTAKPPFTSFATYGAFLLLLMMGVSASGPVLSYFAYRKAEALELIAERSNSGERVIHFWHGGDTDTVAKIPSMSNGGDAEPGVLLRSHGGMLIVRVEDANAEPGSTVIYDLERNQQSALIPALVIVIGSNNSEHQPPELSTSRYRHIPLPSTFNFDQRISKTITERLFLLFQQYGKDFTENPESAINRMIQEFTQDGRVKLGSELRRVMKQIVLSSFRNGGTAVAGQDTLPRQRFKTGKLEHCVRSLLSIARPIGKGISTEEAALRISDRFGPMAIVQRLKAQISAAMEAIATHAGSSGTALFAAIVASFPDENQATIPSTVQPLAMVSIGDKHFDLILRMLTLSELFITAEEQYRDTGSATAIPPDLSIIIASKHRGIGKTELLRAVAKYIQRRLAMDTNIQARHLHQQRLHAQDLTAKANGRLQVQPKDAEENKSMFERASAGIRRHLSVLTASAMRTASQVMGVAALAANHAYSTAMNQAYQEAEIPGEPGVSPVTLASSRSGNTVSTDYCYMKTEQSASSAGSDHEFSWGFIFIVFTLVLGFFATLLNIKITAQYDSKRPRTLRTGREEIKILAGIAAGEGPDSATGSNQNRPALGNAAASAASAVAIVEKAEQLGKNDVERYVAERRSGVIPIYRGTTTEGGTIALLSSNDIHAVHEDLLDNADLVYTKMPLIEESRPRDFGPYTRSGQALSMTDHLNYLDAHIISMLCHESLKNVPGFQMDTITLRSAKTLFRAVEADHVKILINREMLSSVFQRAAELASQQNQLIISWDHFARAFYEAFLIGKNVRAETVSAFYAIHKLNKNYFSSENAAEPWGALARHFYIGLNEIPTLDSEV